MLLFPVKMELTNIGQEVRSMLHGNGTQLGVERSAIQKPSLTTRMADEARVTQYTLAPYGLSAARTEMIGGHDFLTYSQFTQ